MKKHLLIFSISLLCLSGCAYMFGGVEQTVSNPDTGSSDQNKVLCGCNICIETYVWYNEQIVKSYYDHPDSTKNIIKHKQQADSLYAHIKKY